MRILLFTVLLAIAIFANSAAGQKKSSNSKSNQANSGTKSKTNQTGGNKNQKQQENDVIDSNSTQTNNNTSANDTIQQQNHTQNWINSSADYCYDSTGAFKCRQTSPSEYELDCKIVNVDGDPCFPNLAQLIEVSAPLNTISYPIHSFQAQQAAGNIEIASNIITAENIQMISLQAPFQRIPAEAFAGLPHLQRIVLESLDGVKLVNIDPNAFRNSSAKHLHLIGHDVAHVLAQGIDLHNFQSITFSDVEINGAVVGNNNTNASSNTQHIFEPLKSVEALNIESIYVNGQEMNENLLKPLSESLKKLTIDVVFKSVQGQQVQVNQSQLNQGQQQDNATFPVELFSDMHNLQELELYLYEAVNGLSIQNDTTVPLPVSKTLNRLVLSCRYCRNVSMSDIGKWLPNLHQLILAVPLDESVLSESMLKSFSKLEELVIYDGNLVGIGNSAFHSVPALKQLSIKYSPINEVNESSLAGLESLESLSIVGTQIRQINVSSFQHLSHFDISYNQINNIQRDMLPQKAQFIELNISYNPIKHIENGFLSGVQLKNHILRLNGLQIESFDLNAIEGVQNVQVLDITENMNLKKIQISDQKKLPSELERLIVGRSPLLILDDQNGQLSKMMVEENVTLVVEGSVACSCRMNWMVNLQKEHPDLIQIQQSRAICSRQGTQVKNMPESFWKNPNLVNFVKLMGDEKAGLCKDAGEKNQ